MKRSDFSILLIDLNGSYLSTGVRQLSAYLRSKKLNVTVLYLPGYGDVKALYGKDSLYGEASSETLHILAKFAQTFDIIGISILTHLLIPKAIQITNVLRQNTVSPIILGGNPVICDPRFFLSFSEYVCHGEGETLLLNVAEQMMADESFLGVENLGYKDANGDIHLNPIARLIDLKDYPPSNVLENAYFLVDNRLISLEENREALQRVCSGHYSVNGARGCPYACTFCCNNVLKEKFRDKGKLLRFHNTENVILELEHIKSVLGDLRLIKIDEDDFFVRPKENLEEFAIQYRNRVDVPIACNCTISNLREDKLDVLINNGIVFRYMKIGVQSGSEKTNRDIYKRKFDPELTRKRLALLKDMNIKVTIDLITNNPFENSRERAKTAGFLHGLLRDIYKDRKRRRRSVIVQQHKLLFYPNTELFEKAMSAGYIKADYVNEVLLTTSSHPLEDKSSFKHIDIDDVIINVFNFSFLPIPANLITNVFSKPRLYALASSKLSKAFIKLLFVLPVFFKRRMQMLLVRDS